MPRIRQAVVHKSGFETGPTNSAGLADLFENAERANRELLDALVAVQRLKIVDLQLKLTTAYNGLKAARGASNLTPAQRNQIDISYRVCHDAVMGFEP